MRPQTVAERERGTSFVEALIVIAVTALFSIMLSESIGTFARSQGYYRAQARARSTVDRIMLAVGSDLHRCTKLFFDGARGRDILASLDLGSAQPLPRSLLPEGSNRGYIDKDPATDVETGNILLMACGAPSQTVRSNGQESRFGLTKLVAYYLSTTTPNGPLELVRWESEPMIHASELAGVADLNTRAAHAQALLDAGIRIAWDRSAAATTTFFGVNPDGSMPALSSGFRLAADTGGGGSPLLQELGFCVAKNGASIPIVVPQFARPSTGFPHGFEVKCDGDGGGRMVTARLAIRGVAHDSFAVASQLIAVREN